MSRPNVRLDWQAIAAHLDQERDTAELAKATGYPLDRVQRSLWWASGKGLVTDTMRFRRGTAVQIWNRTNARPKAKPTKRNRR